MILFKNADTEDLSLDQIFQFVVVKVCMRECACICLCKGDNEDDKKVVCTWLHVVYDCVFVRDKSYFRVEKKTLQALNLCVGVCQSEGFLVGGGPDTDVKHDMVTAGKFTFPPPSARSVSHALLPSGQFWLACG